MLDRRDAAADLERIYTQITAVATSHDLERSTRTAWSARELVFHLLLDAQRCLVTLATPVDPPPTADHVSYWRQFARSSSASEAERHRRWVSSVAAAYEADAGLLAQWSDTSQAAVRAAAAADAGVVATQGLSLDVADFLDTLVVEATIHYLDLTESLEAPVVDAAALSRAATVVRSMLPGPPPPWSQTELVLRATGRMSLTGEESDAVTAAVPVFS